MKKYILYAGVNGAVELLLAGGGVHLTRKPPCAGIQYCVQYIKLNNLVTG